MSKGLEVSGVKSDAKAATYVYTLSADSGYRANETGRISADRHGLVCRALAGKLDDYYQLAEERAELLEALQKAHELIAGIGYPADKNGRYDKDGEWSFSGSVDGFENAGAVKDAFDVIEAAIANATQQRNATGGER